MPEWLKKLIEKWKEQGINPVPGTWMADLFKWHETGKMPRVVPGEISPIEALLTHPGQVASGLGTALAEEAGSALPGFLNLFNFREQALPRRTDLTVGTKGMGGEVLDLPFGPPFAPPPEIMPPDIQFTGNLGTLPGLGQPPVTGVGSPGLFPGSVVTGQPGTSAHEAWRLSEKKKKPKRVTEIKGQTRGAASRGERFGRLFYPRSAGGSRRR